MAMAASVPSQESIPIGDGLKKIADDAVKFLNENFNDKKFAVSFQKKKKPNKYSDS